MTDDRDSAKSKVAKLMAMATHETANPQEAETALRQAEKLMRKHGIDLAEIAEKTGIKPTYNWRDGLVPAGWPKPIKGQALWFGWIGVGIGKFTDTLVAWHYDQTNLSCLKFKGDEIDVEYAVWLGNHIRNEIRIRANAYDAPGKNSDEKWANREEFRHAMARRINARMEVLRKERTEVYRSTGTALMVIDDKLQQRDARYGVQVYSNRKSSHIRGSWQAHDAGQRAGDQVQIHRPVDQAAKPKEIT
jgi:hypothetical protein